MNVDLSKRELDLIADALFLLAQDRAEDADEGGYERATELGEAIVKEAKKA